MFIVCRSVKQNKGKEMNEGIKNQFHDRTERLEESEPDYRDFEADNYHHEKKRIQGLCAVIFYALLGLSGSYFVSAPILMLYAGKRYLYCNDILVPWLIVGGTLHVVTYLLFILDYVIRKTLEAERHDHRRVGVRRLLLLFIIIIWYVFGFVKILCVSLQKESLILDGDVCNNYLYKVTFCFTVTPFIFLAASSIVLFYSYFIYEK